MKIGIFSDSWVPNLNGVIISIINEVQNLKNKHDFAIFVPKLKQKKSFRIEGIPIYEFKSIPFPAYPGYNIALPEMSFSKALQKEKIDLIHCHSPFSLGYGAILAARVFYDLPLLNTYHTDLIEYSGHLIGGFQAERFTSWFQGIAWIYVKWFYKYSNVVITPSKTLQQKLKSNGVTPPVYALPNMISSVFFKKYQKSSENTRFQRKIQEKYGIKPKDRIIIYCGRISFEKKIEVILEAFKMIEKSHPNTFLLIVGDGPHLKMYQKQAKQFLKNYAFTGFISHTKLPNIYRMGEFMITPSDTETQGLTVIEAMSQELPVIGVSGGGVLDYIENGKNGLLVPPGDSTAFAQAIRTLLDNPDIVSEFSKNAYKTALKFSRKGFTSLLEKVFRLTIEYHSSSSS
ncbi:MAG: glycosyltransferase [Candidatus Hodarchaeales archaeon]